MWDVEGQEENGFQILLVEMRGSNTPEQALRPTNDQAQMECKETFLYTGGNE